jgi:hypothetical protein
MYTYLFTYLFIYTYLPGNLQQGLSRTELSSHLLKLKKCFVYNQAPPSLKYTEGICFKNIMNGAGARGSVVVKALRYNQKVAGSIPDKVNL